MTPETLTAGGAEALLDGDEDGGFLGARAADHAAHVLPGVSWSHLGQPQPRAMYLGGEAGSQPGSHPLPWYPSQPDLARWSFREALPGRTTIHDPSIPLPEGWDWVQWEEVGDRHLPPMGQVR